MTKEPTLREQQAHLVGQETADGMEIHDTTPVAVPANFKAPVPLAQTIKALVRDQLSEMASNQGLETMEDADDFDIPDDPIDERTPYERHFDIPPTPQPSEGTHEPSGGLNPSSDARGVSPASESPSQVPTPPAGSAEAPQEAVAPPAPPSTSPVSGR